MGISLAGPALLWFRDDLRLSDNPALSAAVADGSPLLCFFILDESSQDIRPLGSASRWWLHGSLEALDKSLRSLGGRLILFRGPAEDVINRIVAATAPSALFWNRRYQAAEIAIDGAVKAKLHERGIAVRSFNGRLLHEPWEIRNQADKPFQIFTPYLRAVSARSIAGPLPAPTKMSPGHWPPAVLDSSVSLTELRLHPTRPDWSKKFSQYWKQGETAAQEALDLFLESSLCSYGERRDNPGAESTSRLSPHLRFGEISPRQLWHAATIRGSGHETGTAKFLSEVVWRDFCHQQLYASPDLGRAPYDPRFAHFPWSEDGVALNAWRKGLTGYPIVDAGMRQLWRTGWVHNRVRMIVGSFLVKHLLIDWRRGETWFWDTLVDADPANNAFNWQWIAGSGPDSAPFHRIFNPVTQGEKFDPAGDYVRMFVPELSALPANVIHRPWKATHNVLHAAGVELGGTYPRPVVDHGAARERALRAFRSMREDAT